MADDEAPPPAGPIKSIRLPDEDGVSHWYTVGPSCCDSIEPFTVGGMYCDLHFVRVVRDGKVIFEIAKHLLLGIYYG